uniref:Uncharacterized protein n=1 Tax=Anguilla anguilla TaxID=7936 RepID=A0A0E9PV21_ANGAN
MCKGGNMPQAVKSSVVVDQ